MVARQERAGLGIMQTDVIGCMTGRMQDEPFPTGQLEDVAVLDVMRDGRKKFAAADRREIEPAQLVPKRTSL